MRKTPATTTPSERPNPASGSVDAKTPGASDAPAVASVRAETKHPADAGQAPPATASVFVFSPQQAVPSTSPAAEAPAAETPAPEAPASVPTALEEPKPAEPGELHLSVVASASEIAPGAIMTVDVMAASSSAVVDAPIHVTFDPRVVEFIDGATGDFLTQGGSSVVFLADGLTRPGDVAIAAGRIEREQGASGTGLLCRVRFRGVATGTTPVQVGPAKAWGTRGEELTVLAGGTTVAVN